MNEGAHIKVVAGKHAGAYGEIWGVHKNHDGLHIEFLYPHNGFTGSLIRASEVVLVTEKEWFKAKLRGTL